jgi:ketosteroid isomerase-like protein
MLKRRPMRIPLAAALAATLIGFAPGAWSAPADDLRDAQRLYSQGKAQQAMEKVDAALKFMPKDPQARFLKGLLLTEQKRTSDAIAVFTGLTEDFPELPEPYNNLAVLYASQGNYDKAKAALELAIHTHPSYATAHENLGDVYAQLASRAYDRALQLDKNNAAAQVKLAMVKDLFSSQKATSGSGAVKPAPKSEYKPEPSAAPPKLEPPTRPDFPPAGKPETPAKVVQAAPPKAATAPPPVAPPAAAPAAAPAKPSAPAPAPAAAAGGEDKAKITAAIEAWAKAWSAKDVKAYLDAYASDFAPPDGLSREAWEKQRTERIERPKSIDVQVKVLSVEVKGGEAKATIRQAYRSDTLRNTTTKTLALVRSGDRWLIKQERVGG